jgi:acetyl-CoA carboxylase biotin carboxyl carrier protein
MIDLRYVKKLIEMLDSSSVDSVEISTDKGMKIRISKTPQHRGPVQISTPVPVPASGTCARASDRRKVLVIETEPPR